MWWNRYNFIHFLIMFQFVKKQIIVYFQDSDSGSSILGSSGFSEHVRGEVMSVARSRLMPTLIPVSINLFYSAENNNKQTLGSTTLPSIVWLDWARTSFTLEGKLKVMNPKPLDLRVAGSFITITSATSPNFEKYSRTFWNRLHMIWRQHTYYGNNSLCKSLVLN